MDLVVNKPVKDKIRRIHAEAVVAYVGEFNALQEENNCKPEDEQQILVYDPPKPHSHTAIQNLFTQTDTDFQQPTFAESLRQTFIKTGAMYQDDGIFVEYSSANMKVKGEIKITPTNAKPLSKLDEEKLKKQPQKTTTTTAASTSSITTTTTTEQINLVECLENFMDNLLETGEMYEQSDDETDSVHDDNISDSGCSDSDDERFDDDMED
jgi:hypothetical protein